VVEKTLRGNASKKIQKFCVTEGKGGVYKWLDNYRKDMTTKVKYDLLL
jgi:hypothetical protein